MAYLLIPDPTNSSYLRPVKAGTGLRLYGSSSGSVGLKSPASASGDYTLPSALPGASSLLTSSSSGVLTWTAASTYATNASLATVAFTGAYSDLTGLPTLVSSVNSRTGAVTLTSSDVGLGSVTNDAQTKASVVPNTAPAAGRILVGNAGGTAYAPVAMSGDATLASAGAITLATVNSNTGSFGDASTVPTITVNGKGLITAVTTAAVIAPAGTLSGTTLNSTVVTSSLTTVGTIGTGVWNAGTVTSSGSITAASGSAFLFASRSQMTSPADGVVLFQNNAATGLTGIKLGGTTSSFPYIKRNSAGIDFRVGDDTAYAAIAGSIASFSGQTISSGGGTSNVPAYNFGTSGDGIGYLTGYLHVTSSGSIKAILGTGSYLSSTGQFGFSNASSVYLNATIDTIIRRAAAANIALGDVAAAAPVAQTLSVQNVSSGTSNTAGANFTIAGSQGTGTGNGGSLIFQVAPAGTTGTSVNALATALTIASDKSATFAGNISGLHAPRVVTVSDATSITPNCGTTDICYQVNTQAAGTLTVNAPTGTPVDGQQLIVRLKCTNAQTLSFNATYNGSTDSALPSTTSGSLKYDYLLFKYNSGNSKWDFISKDFGH